MIKGWLTTAMEKDFRSSVKYANTTSDIWSDIEDLRTKATIHDDKEGRSIFSSYHTKLRSIWDEIQLTTPTPRCDCTGCSYDLGKRLNESRDKERMSGFLMGLNSEYPIIKARILSIKPTPSLEWHIILLLRTNSNEPSQLLKGLITKQRRFKLLFKIKRNLVAITNNNTKRSCKRISPRKEASINQNDALLRKEGIQQRKLLQPHWISRWWPNKSKQENGQAKIFICKLGIKPHTRVDWRSIPKIAQAFFKR
uniref:Retrotransposon gag domain-containing protein n=1 Tax=Lactuca sativa TaxID=4236 RepID=A0A9R1XLW2_LACSA|nr:hypothetical protein LSAT_V11C400208440 [Lactuca sativa]